jgi:hypothetical protein
MNQHGIWSLQEAQAAHVHSPELARNLAALFRKEKPVLDFGCGVGFYASFLSREGFTVRAFEGTPGIEAISLFKPIEPFDLSQTLDPALRGQVLCLEVGEHVPAEFEDTVLRNLANATEDLLVLSWAVPGQGGHGHVNERPNEHIVNKLQRLGLEYDPSASHPLRQDVGPCWWFRNTVLVFRKPAPEPVAPGEQQRQTPGLSAKAFFRKLLDNDILVRLETEEEETSASVAVQGAGFGAEAQTRDHYVRFLLDPGYVRLTFSGSTEFNSGDFARCDWATNNPLDGTVHLHVRAAGPFGHARATVHAAFAIEASALGVLNALSDESGAEDDEETP